MAKPLNTLILLLIVFPTISQAGNTTQNIERKVWNEHMEASNYAGREAQKKYPDVQDMQILLSYVNRQMQTHSDCIQGKYNISKNQYIKIISLGVKLEWPVPPDAEKPGDCKKPNKQKIYSREQIISMALEYLKNSETGKGRELLTDLAQAGDAEAMFILGNNILENAKTEEEFKEAFQLSSKSAKKGDVDAMNMVGHMLYNGKGVKKDMSKAVDWWDFASRRGQVHARFNIAKMYWYGIVLPKNKKKARKLFESAARGGDKEAREFLADIVPNEKFRGLWVLHSINGFPPRSKITVQISKEKLAIYQKSCVTFYDYKRQLSRYTLITTKSNCKGERKGAIDRGQMLFVMNMLKMVSLVDKNTLILKRR